jgi:hypothetical protein
MHFLDEGDVPADFSLRIRPPTLAREEHPEVLRIHEEPLKVARFPGVLGYQRTVEVLGPEIGLLRLPRSSGSRQ